MSGFEFPPQVSGSGDSWDRVDYPVGDRSGGFIFPPPQSVVGGDLDASTRELSDAVGQWRDKVDATAGEVHNLGTVVEDYGTAVEDLGKDRVMPWAVPTVAPLSQSINRRADATFQLQGFMSLDNPLAGNTRGESGHFHALTGDHPNAGRVETRLAEGWTVGNRTYLAFVAPAVTRVYNGIDFMVGETSGTPSILDFALFRTDENRQLTSLIGVQRVNPAEVGTGRQVISRTFTPTLVQQGEYIAIAVRQWSSGEQRPLLGVHDVDRPLKNAVFPRKITATWNSTSSIPSMIDGESELDFTDDWFIPYIELSEDVGIDYRVFNEQWPDVGGQAGRPWVHLTSTGIRSSGGYTAAGGSGVRVSMYDTPLSTEYSRVRTSIYNAGSSANERRTTIIFRASNDLRSGIGLSAIAGYRYELIRWSGLNVDSDDDWNDRTLISTINRVPQQGDQIEIDYLDGQVIVRINGTVQFDRTVSGYGGAARRFLGIQNRRQSFITATFSPWLGHWSARDLPQDAGDEDGDEEGEEG